MNLEFLKKYLLISRKCKVITMILISSRFKVDSMIKQHELKKTSFRGFFHL